MKLSTALLFVAGASSAAAKTISGKAAAKVLRAGRRLEENNQNGEDQQEDEYAFLAKYNMKMVSCSSTEVIQNPETGEYEYGAVVVRLCASDDGCSDDSATGCSEGYGDFVVGINTFVDANFEDMRDNMQWDDRFQVDRYAECAEYEVEEGDDQYANYQFYIGPTCSEDGASITLGFFSDATCTTKSEVAFEDVSGGMALPYENQNMVQTDCVNCYDQNDNGEYELREMCMNTYMNSVSKCEEQMAYTGYYGADTSGCEYVTALLPKSASKGNGGKVFGWLVFVMLVGGAAAYIVWWRKKKSDIVA